MEIILAGYPSYFRFPDEARGFCISHALLDELDKRMTGSSLRHKISLKFDQTEMELCGSASYDPDIDHHHIELVAINLRPLELLWETVAHEYCHVLVAAYPDLKDLDESPHGDSNTRRYRRFDDEHPEEFWQYADMIEEKFPERPPGIDKLRLAKRWWRRLFQCPKCRRLYAEGRVPSSPRIAFDRCMKCHSVLIKLPSVPPPPKAPGEE